MQQLKRSEIILLLKLSAMKVFVFLIICIVVGCISGCKTGGSWVKSSSPNVRVVSQDDLVRKSDGTYSLKKGNVAPKKESIASRDIPQAINEPEDSESKFLSKKLNSGSVKSSPRTPKNSSVENQPLPAEKIKSTGEPATLNPTVNNTDLAMNVRPNDQTPKGKIDKPMELVIIEEEKEMSIDWPALLTFYFIAIMALVFTWMMYDLIKDFLNRKNTKKDNPFYKEQQIKQEKVKRKRPKSLQ